MTRLDRETGAVVPFHCRAGVVSRGTLAAELEQAPALLRALVIEGLGKQTLVIERPAVTPVVHALTVEHLGPPDVVQLRQAAKSQEVRQNLPVRLH